MGVSIRPIPCHNDCFRATLSLSHTHTHTHALLGTPIETWAQFHQRLRNRQFERPRLWKTDSISYRLATCAIKEIKEIEVARSKKGLAKKYKNKILLVEYNTPCRIRNCLICDQVNQHHISQEN